MLATAWALFSGPTHYISLATVAFFGIGAYTVAVVGELHAVAGWCWSVAALIGIVVALVVGLSTLRLSGIYFVIFTFGLSELIRQLVTWYEVNIHRSVGRYIFLEITQPSRSTGSCSRSPLLVLAVGWLIGRSRLGLALRVIGEDEIVARHAGIDTTRAKLALFAVSALFMTLTGAVMAPRWTYIDPTIAFKPMLSFEVVIMALLGGAGALFGPLLGVVPLVLLFEVLSANFPNYFSDPARHRVHPHRLRAAARRDRADPAALAARVQRWPRRRPRSPHDAAPQGALLEVEGLRKASAAWSRSTICRSRCAAARSSA